MKIVRRLYWPALGVVTVGFTVSTLVAHFIWRNEVEALQADFNAAAENRVAAFRREVQTRTANLVTWAQLLSGAPAAERAILLRLATTAKLTGHCLRFHGAASEREAVAKLESTEAGSPGLAWRVDALRRALRSRQPAATPALPPAPGLPARRLVSTFVPVFAEQGRRLAGFLESVDSPAEMLERGLAALRPSGVHVELRDHLNPSELVYRHSSRKRGPVPVELKPYVATAEWADHTWQVACTASAAGPPTLGRYPWIVFCCGVTLSLLLATYIHSYVVRTQRIEAKVQQRTLDLATTAAQLERQIAEKNAAEIALAQARDEALASSRLKTRFLAHISHEMRTPIVGILGALDMLQATPLSPQQLGLLEMLRHSSSALRDLVDDLLDMARIESGTLRLDPRPFALGQLLKQCLSMVAHLSQCKGVPVDLSAPPPPLPWLVGDDRRLRQVIVNLLTNALKFTPSGSVRLEVHPPPSPGAAWRFEVHDTGIGIPADQQQRIFEPFVQVDSGDGRRFGGAGLGLAICKHLIASMGGELDLQSSSNKGSCFWFTVPLPETAPPGAEPVAVPAGIPATRRILLAEDNPVNAKVTEWHLRRLGCSADVVADGEAVLAALARANYDLILMDCQMPGVDGFEATQRIRREPSAFQKIPIVALTANAFPEDRLRCLEAGMDDYLSKPIDLQALAAALNRWLWERPSGAEGRGSEPAEPAPIEAG
jgi:signal transduction histidine kinase/CheY-like chemotaxis protein